MKRCLSYILAVILSAIPCFAAVGYQAEAAAESTDTGLAPSMDQASSCYVPETLTEFYNEAILSQGSGTGTRNEESLFDSDIIRPQSRLSRAKRSTVIISHYRTKA